MTENYIPVTELFKQFCKERHAEDKGKNYDKLQEIYANTELFDLSFLPVGYFGTDDLFREDKCEVYTVGSTADITHEMLKSLSLPFESQFISLGINGHDKICVFIREYSFSVLTGTIYSCSTKENFSINAPFTLRTNTGNLKLDMKGYKEYIEYLGQKRLPNNYSIDSDIYALLRMLLFALSSISNLPKYSVACDRTTKCEYYRRHRASTIKVNKPIYYILDKQEEQVKREYHRIKPIGSITFDHSFKVRGHWRRIDTHTLGKNRNNEYVCRGVTWVKEHVRGEGELMKKVRVVKTVPCPNQ